MPNRLARTFRTAGSHPVDPNLPGHWTGIVEGQTKEERQAAIMVNVAMDKRKKRNPEEALNRIRELG